jgi:hypothetical protein
MLLSRLVFMSVELKRRIIQGQELIHFGIHFQYQVHYWSGGEVENGGDDSFGWVERGWGRLWFGRRLVERLNEGRQLDFKS